MITMVFSAVVDSGGGGLLETASLISPGDADLDSYIDIITDQLFTGIAYGSTGPARDHDNFLPYTFLITSIILMIMPVTGHKASQWE
jgi:hypothetical protein